MNGVLDHNSALEGYIESESTCAKEISFFLNINHTPGAGSIARPVNQQSGALPLYHGCPDATKQ